MDSTARASRAGGQRVRQPRLRLRKARKRCQVRAVTPMKAQKKRKPMKVWRSQPQAEVSSKSGRAAALQNGKAGEAMILAPGGTVLWRLRSKGKIERSVDSGVSWSRQNSGVNAELLAGSAPSDAVCWVVGRAGTILRTTDGGGHWSRVVSPIAGNVGGIRAVDAMHATVFGVGGERQEWWVCD